MKKFDELASEEQVKKTAEALNANGMKTYIVENGKEAKEKALELIPKGEEVLANTSATADEIGLTPILNDPEHYDQVKSKVTAIDDEEKRHQARRIHSTAKFIVGSVHAVTEKGEVLVASNTGSQLAPYVYSAAHVIWLVGTQKLVKDMDEAMKRLYEYVLPLEDKRMQEAYGRRSNVSKLLVVNKEVNPERIKIILIKEKLGF